MNKTRPRNADSFPRRESPVVCLQRIPIRRELGYKTRIPSQKRVPRGPSEEKSYMKSRPALRPDTYPRRGSPVCPDRRKEESSALEPIYSYLPEERKSRAACLKISAI
jgi:hypothetical protein